VSAATGAAAKRRLSRIVPYVVVLAIVVFLYVLASRIEFTAPGGRIGPNFWPKAILILAMVACGYEIVKRLFFAKPDAEDLEGVLGSVLKSTPAAQEARDVGTAGSRPDDMTLHPRLLWSGIALTVLYLFAVEKLGFFLTTALYLGTFMWIGRYRRIGVIVATSLIGALAFVFVFMKIVYVSLPLGQEPFAQVSYLLMKLLAIR
jgi:putative tricarboxylic transport membrane protein